MKKNTLLSSGALYTLGNILIQGLAFITLPIYTRIITPEVFGQFNLYSSWVTMITIFIGLQTIGSLSIAKVRFNDYDTYVNNALIVSHVVALSIFLCLFLGKDIIAPLMGIPANLVVLATIHSYVSFILGFTTTYFIQIQKVLYSFLVSLINAIITVALSLTLISLMQDDLAARVFGGVIPGVIFSILALIYLHSKSFVLKKQYILFAITVSSPLIFHHLGHAILNQFDRIMIGKMMTTTDVAMYSFGYSLGAVIQIVLFSLNTIWVQWSFQQKKNNLPNLKEMTKKYLLISIFLTLGYLTIYPEIATILGGAKYRTSIAFIPAIICSYFFAYLYTFPVNVQFYHGNTFFIPIGTLLSGGINIVLNYYAIPILGINGAVIATICSYIILLILHHIISRYKYQYTDMSVKGYIFSSVTVLIYAWIMNQFSSSWIMRWLVGICVIVMYSVYFKDDIKQFIKSRRNQ